MFLFAKGTTRVDEKRIKWTTPEGLFPGRKFAQEGKSFRTEFVLRLKKVCNLDNVEIPGKLSFRKFKINHIV